MVSHPHPASCQATIPQNPTRSRANSIYPDMHPLALEDVLHQRVHTRSKADYYQKHLFIRLLCHTLSNEDQDAPPDLTHLPRSESPEPVGKSSHDDSDSEDDEAWKANAQAGMFSPGDDKTVYGSGSGSKFSTRSNTMRNTMRRKYANGLPDVEMSSVGQPNGRFAGLQDDEKKNRKNARNEKIIRELKKGERVNVKIQPMCIFLFRDGTAFRHLNLPLS